MGELCCFVFPELHVTLLRNGPVPFSLPGPSLPSFTGPLLPGPVISEPILKSLKSRARKMTDFLLGGKDGDCIAAGRQDPSERFCGA